MMNESKKRQRSIVTLAMLFAVCAVGLVSPTLAADALQSQDSNVAGVAAEIIECKRADGVLTIKLRFRNTTETDVNLYPIEGRNFDAYYVSASNKKYFVLRDTEKTPLASPADGFGNLSTKLAKGAAYTFWVKYPAPPADIKKVSFYTPLTPPFDGVPISD